MRARPERLSAPSRISSLDARSSIRLCSFLRDVWLPAIRHTIRPNTFEDYRSNIRTRVLCRLGDVPLIDIDPPMLNRFYAQLLSKGRFRGQGRLAPRSVLRTHTVLQRALRDAVRWGYLADNPADRCDPPRANDDHVLKTWDANELGGFLRFVASDPLYPLWHLLAMTGMRRGEALGLRWPDVEVTERRLAIRRGIVVVEGDLVVSAPKSAKGRRTVALDDLTVEVLLRHRDQEGNDGYLFAEPGGGPLDPRRISTTFARLVKASGLPRIRLHDLRHTHASLALRAGVHPKIVSERLGHSSVAFTLDVYSHVLPSLQKEAAEAVGRIIFARPGSTSRN